MKLKFLFALMLTLVFSPLFVRVNTMAQEPDITVTDVEFVEWVTGPESPNETDTRYNVYGTDLGSMFELDGTVSSHLAIPLAAANPLEAARAAEAGAATSSAIRLTAIWKTA